MGSICAFKGEENMTVDSDHDAITQDDSMCSGHRGGH